MTLIYLRSASGMVIHGPYLSPDRKAWTEMERNGCHVSFVDVKK